MTSCHTSHINFSHCITGGSWRLNFLFGKMLGSSLFHILWTSRSSFSPCPYGIVVVVFHFDSGGRKAKAKDRYQLIGGKHRSKCCPKPCVLRFLQHTARLQPYDCFTIFFAYMILGRVNWKRISQKNNMVFGVADVWKNIL